MSIELNNNGRIVFNPFLKPYTAYPPNSEEWHVAFSRSVQSEFDRMQFAHPKEFAMLLVKAVNTDYRPWEYWPEEAKGSPDKYFRLVIGCSWAGARQMVIGQGGEEGRQWCNVIDGAMQEWEAKKRKRTGRRKAEVMCDTHDLTDDGHDANGLRRRIQKRANAGDPDARVLAEQLKAGTISPNAAAIAAGMREKYIRISPSPSKAAKSLASKQGREWCLQLLEELSELCL